MIVRTLSTADCTALLAANRLARLACTKDGRPYVVPIYYAYADNHLYAFSMPGKKVEWMRSSPQVSRSDRRARRRARMEKRDRRRPLRRTAGSDRSQARAGPCVVAAEQACRLVGARRPTNRSRLQCPIIRRMCSFGSWSSNCPGEKRRNNMFRCRDYHHAGARSAFATIAT